MGMAAGGDAGAQMLLTEAHARLEAARDRASTRLIEPPAPRPCSSVSDGQVVGRSALIRRLLGGAPVLGGSA